MLMVKNKDIKEWVDIVYENIDVIATLNDKNLKQSILNGLDEFVSTVETEKNILTPCEYKEDLKLAQELKSIIVTNFKNRGDY